MKITIEKKQIENALIKAIPFLENKDMSMITSNVSIVLKDGSMVVSSTNYEVGLKSTIQTLGIITDGEVIVNGKKLLDFIKVLRNDILLEVKGNFLHISQGRSKFKVAIFNDGAFPKFPDVETFLTLDIDSNMMMNAFGEITPSIDTNNPKYEFNGAMMHIKSDSINFVSTDMKRLSTVGIQSVSDNEMSIIIPRVAIIEMQKLFHDDIKIYCDDTYLVIESDSLFFFTKLINGKFPDTKRVIPTSSKHNIVISKFLMIESLKLINTVSNEVQIEISNNKMLFSSVEDANNNAVTDIEIEFETDEVLSLGANSKFILDFLNVIYDDKFTLSLNESSMPFVLQSGQLKTVVMPVTL